MTEEPTFSLTQALAAQGRLREALGLGEERFPMPAFIGMISDEIERMREAGHDDAATARMISETTGVPVDGADLARHFADPERRAR